MGRLSVRGKYIYRDGSKFFARGVSYGPFAPNSQGEAYPEPDRVRQDFALMSELGANLVRTYVKPPSWVFEQAAKHGLMLMPGISWPQHLTFLDSPEIVREVRNTIRQEILALRQFSETIFAYNIGNEIRSDIVRWHGARAVSKFLEELYDLGKQCDPEGLLTYSNYPSAEYLDVSFLDFISFNVYLHRETDFRRYLTHLLAISGKRPLVLSETGIDTIREGEQKQAEVLGWQLKSAFELGLSGVVIFAFTDEWFRGGTQISDWAFGLTTHERSVKPSFAVVAAIFRHPLPPALPAPPKASVVVAAYNAAPTIATCLESLKRLNYPDYEIIVVDDGSHDSTAKIAEGTGVQTLRLTHQGLAAARNAGLAQAKGRVVAFIDADAEADRDWLYHLVETITRRNAAATGGQNFAPEPTTFLGSILNVAPGQAHEVRSGDQDLAQLCGCNMAVDKTAIGATQIFDYTFRQAGDDVDLSWRLRDLKKTIAYAPGAIVLHKPRPSIWGYLKQQMGYGYAEGLLFRKYPGRRERLYNSSNWFNEWFGSGSRIYYGTFGRGLFQSLYPVGSLPFAALLPLTFPWVAVAILMAFAGIYNRVWGILGGLGLCITMVCAVAGAMTSAKEVGGCGRALLAVLWLLGPLLRSCQRELVKWSFAPDRSGQEGPLATGLRGTIPLQLQSPASGENEPIGQGRLKLLTDHLHLALVRRGLAVAKGSSYDAFDLQIIVAPFVRVAVLFLNNPDSLFLAWRIGLAGWRLGVTFVALIMLLAVGNVSPKGGLTSCAFVAATMALVAFSRALRVPSIIQAVSVELSAQAFTGTAQPSLPELDPLG
jgi:cellulose synthase/poly-beta-1,6-N-acetylglucosamine synthase-like glycosyltransferase